MAELRDRDSPSDYGSSPSQLQRRWARELNGAKRRLNKFHKAGVRVGRKFRDDSGTGDRDSIDIESVDVRLNLFNSNIITLQSMLFGSEPKTDVKRRFNDADDDVARVSALILNRMLQGCIEDPAGDFQDVIRCSLQDRLLPGLGVARVRYELETEEVEVEEVTDEFGNVLQEAYTDERIVKEDAPIDYVFWKDFAWGWARTWKEVPWVAFRSYLTQDKVEERFGKKVANQLEYSKQTEDEEATRDEEDVWATTPIWEIWCKDEKMVYWFSEHAQRILGKEEDPLGLPGFFPCAPPMASNLTTSQYLPKSDYILAQDLYNEIDVLQTRISILTRACKAVGVYDKNNDGVKRMMNEGVDNDLIPVDNWAMFAEKGGLRGTIDWMPLEMIVNVLDKLRSLRDEAIALLHQVTGLSDILRGSSQQYATAKAEELKSKFASIRVQAIQDEFAKFASNLMTLKACIIQKHFDTQSIISQSNIVYASEEPQIVKQAIELMKSPPDNAYRVEIRPESVAMVDYAQLKAERTEYLTAMSTFLQSAQAVIKVEPGAAPFLIQLMKWGLAGFKGSNEIEGVVDKALAAMEAALKKPKPPQPSPEEQKAKVQMQAQQQKHQNEMQKEMFKATNEMRKLAQEFKQELAVLNRKLQGEVFKEQAQAVAKISEIQAAAEAKNDGR